MSKPTAIIIGAGAGGLATANLLASTGWQVSVFEQFDKSGGRAGLLEQDGFRFDTGPSWYLMPEVFEHYFALLGREVGAYLDLKQLDPAYRVYYDYHQPITIHSNRDKDNATFAAIEPGADRALSKYLHSSERAYNLAIKYFLYNTFRSKTSFMKAEVLAHAPSFARSLVESLDSFVSRSFSALPLQQILQYPAVFLATQPRSAPALYHLMSHLDFNQGVFYPKGGIYELIKSLESIGRELGVAYHFNAPVSHIVTSQRHATGITLADGTTYTADVVISNTDLHFTETVLLDRDAQSYPESSWKKRTSGPSALLMYLGVIGELPDLTHHNLLFMKAWKENFESIFGSQQWPDRPSMYVCKASATDPSVAPVGHENVFVLVPLPATTDYPSEKLTSYAARCIDSIASICQIPDLASRIVYQKLYGPADFESQLNAWHGSALGLGHILRQSAFFRPANRSRKIRNLYYVGGDTQPGIGLPMCLISAELVYKYLTDDRSPGPLRSLRTPIGGWHV
jgi:phytoene desaturase